MTETWDLKLDEKETRTIQYLGTLLAQKRILQAVSMISLWSR